MAFREKNPNILAAALEGGKKLGVTSKVQKQRGYTVHPSFPSDSDKENVEPWQAGILAEYDSAVTNHKVKSKKDEGSPVPEMVTLGLARQQEGDVKKAFSETKKPAPSRPMDFSAAVRSSLGAALPFNTTTKQVVAIRNAKPNKYYAPSLGNYTETLSIWSKSKNSNAGNCAQEVLQQMRDRFKSGECDIRPDSCCYNMVIMAFKDDPDKAEEVLRLMWEDYAGGNTTAEPNLRVYTSLLNAWSRSKVKHAPERCETILQQLQQMHDSRTLQNCKPDLFAYTAVLQSWAVSKVPDAGRRAEVLFRHMLTRFYHGDKSLRPDAAAYGSLIHAYTGGLTAHRAGDILWEMVGDFLNANGSAKPDVRIFNSVISVWSKTKSPHAPERAQEILNRIHILYNEGVLEFKPNSYAYSLVLKSWAVSGRDDAADRANAFLSWMKELNKAGDRQAQLTSIQYTTCIGIWVSAENMGRAAALWDEMFADYMDGNSYAEPDIMACNRILTGWARSNNSTAVDRAEAMLQQMWRLHDTGLNNIRPSVGSYNSLVFCWKHSNRSYAPVRVDTLLQEMDHFHMTGRMEHPPNHVSFRTVLKTWKQSAHSPAKSARIRTLERELYKRFGITADGGNKATK